MIKWIIIGGRTGTERTIALVAWMDAIAITQMDVNPVQQQFVIVIMMMDVQTNKGR